MARLPKEAQEELVHRMREFARRGRELSKVSVSISDNWRSLSGSFVPASQHQAADGRLSAAVLRIAISHDFAI